jgi:hypothetical protein
VWDEQRARALTSGREEPELVVLSPAEPERSGVSSAF